MNTKDSFLQATCSNTLVFNEELRKMSSELRGGVVSSRFTSFDAMIAMGEIQHVGGYVGGTVRGVATEGPVREDL